MYRMTDEEFESAIAEALDAMPEQFMEAFDFQDTLSGTDCETESGCEEFL